MFLGWKFVIVFLLHCGFQFLQFIACAACTSAGLLVLPPSWREKPYFLPDHSQALLWFLIHQSSHPCIALHPLSPLRQQKRTSLVLCPSNIGVLLPGLSPVSLVLSPSPSKHSVVTRIFLNRFFHFKIFMRCQLLFVIVFLALPSKYASSKHTSLLLHLYSPYLKSRQNAFFFWVQGTEIIIGVYRVKGLKRLSHR